MPKRSRKPPKDPILAAKSILEQATGESDPIKPEDKDPAAVALGRRGGLKGGAARAKALTAEERRASAKAAAEARWGRKQLPKDGR